jgi:hypothetical protein
MKKLLLISTLLFSAMFSTPSYGEWTKVTKSVDGSTYYADFDRIRKHDGYVYVWEIGNFLKPLLGKYFSGKIYRQYDCKLFRSKMVSSSYHQEPMGYGPGVPGPEGVPDWEYPPPNSIHEKFIQRVCSQ